MWFSIVINYVLKHVYLKIHHSFLTITSQLLLFLSLIKLFARWLVVFCFIFFGLKLFSSWFFLHQVRNSYVWTLFAHMHVTISILDTRYSNHTHFTFFLHGLISIRIIFRTFFHFIHFKGNKGLRLEPGFNNVKHNECRVSSII